MNIKVDRSPAQKHSSWVTKKKKSLCTHFLTRYCSSASFNRPTASCPWEERHPAVVAGCDDVATATRLLVVAPPERTPKREGSAFPVAAARKIICIVICYFLVSVRSETCLWCLLIKINNFHIVGFFFLTFRFYGIFGLFGAILGSTGMLFASNLKDFSLSDF